MLTESTVPSVWIFSSADFGGLSGSGRRPLLPLSFADIEPLQNPSLRAAAFGETCLSNHSSSFKEPSQTSTETTVTLMILMSLSLAIDEPSILGLQVGYEINEPRNLAE